MFHCVNFYYCPNRIVFVFLLYKVHIDAMRRYDYWETDEIKQLQALQGNGFGTDYSILYGLHAAPEMQHLHSMGGLLIKPGKRGTSGPEFKYKLTTAALRNKMMKYFIHNFVTAAQELDLFTLGHVFHMLEDSFSRSHVDRDCAKYEQAKQDLTTILTDEEFLVLKYLNYTKQDKNGHGDVEDYNSVFGNALNPFDPLATKTVSKEDYSLLGTAVPNPNAPSYYAFMMAVHAAYMVISRFFVCASLPRGPGGVFTENIKIKITSCAEEVFNMIYKHSEDIPEFITVEDCGTSACKKKTDTENPSQNEMDVNGIENKDNNLKTNDKKRARRRDTVFNYLMGNTSSVDETQEKEDTVNRRKRANPDS